MPLNLGTVKEMDLATPLNIKSVFSKLRRRSPVVQSSSNVSSFLPVAATPVQAVTVGLMNAAAAYHPDAFHHAFARAHTASPGRHVLD